MRLYSVHRLVVVEDPVEDLEEDPEEGTHLAGVEDRRDNLIDLLARTKALAVIHKHIKRHDERRT